MDSRYIDILTGIEEKKSKFQHYASIFSFVKNTKLQLYESIMQNLSENYLVIKVNTTHTHTHTHKHNIFSRQKDMLKIPCSIKKFDAKSSPCRSREPEFGKYSVLIFEIMKASTIVTNCFILDVAELLDSHLE